MPLTPNGKVNRAALPAPHRASAPVRNPESEIVMTPTQRRVADLWAEILRTDRISLHDNFFDVGGHSMLVVKLHAALQQEFDIGPDADGTVPADNGCGAGRAGVDVGGRRSRVAPSRSTGEETTSWLIRCLITRSRSLGLQVAFLEPTTSTDSGAILRTASNAWMCRPTPTSMPQA